MKYLVIAVSIALTFTACKKKEDEVENPVVQTYGTMDLKFDHRWGHDHAGGTPSLDFALNTNFILHGTTDTVKFTKLRYYISNVQLTAVNGTIHTVKDSYHLVDVATGSLPVISLDSIPTNEYIKVTYTVGVDSLKNVSGAQQGDLAPSKEMFWNWNTGYRFIVAEGAQVKAAGDTMFVCHIGGFSGSNNALKTLDFSFESNLTVSPSATPRAHFKINVGALWNNTTPIQQYRMIHMPGSKAVELANNFAASIDLDHAHE